MNSLRVLFLCTGNSCRSQMAEGWAHHLKPGVVEAYSAGIETHGLNPHAVSVMAEQGVDISGQESQHVDELAHVDLDVVVTVCDRAAESFNLDGHRRGSIIRRGVAEFAFAERPFRTDH